MIKVVVIDDQPLEGKMIEYTLSHSCQYAEYRGQAFNASDGIAMTEKEQPHITPRCNCTEPSDDTKSGVSYQ